MGSLPNLHELCKDEVGSGHAKIGPAISNPHQHSINVTGHCGLTQDERNRILHRHSTHCKQKQTAATISCNKQQDQRASKLGYDDFMLEVNALPAQMAAYSPISSRSTRNLPHAIRRRDSMNSSIGANSVRRLIAVVRNTNSRMGPVYTRKVLIRNLALVCVTHILVTATFLPFLALQGSVSIFQPTSADFTINIGSFLLSLLHIFAAVSTLFGPILCQKLGTTIVMAVGYTALCLFHAVHFHPILYLIIPVYVVFGMVLGPLNVARMSFLMTVSTKLNYIFGEEDEEAKTMRRTCIIRRVARAFQAAHDFGLIFGSILTAVLITVTINFTSKTPANGLVTNVTLNATNLTYNYYEYNSFLDDIFDVDELGERLCGAQACPSDFILTGEFKVLPERSSIVLIGVYVGVSLVAVLVMVFFVDRIRLCLYQDSVDRGEGFRGIREAFRDVRLQLAAPMAVFIGMEQAFMYADFSKSYVVCTLGIHRLNLVFLCMGLLQSIAACTLSMLLRTIRRYYVIAVGFTFHACLLMVQMLWKPIGDDPALFYVISAAWGVCNAVWEMMNFTLLTGLYGENWECPFANSLFYRFLGLAVAFGCHGLLCNWLKLYLLGSAMLVAVVPFAWLEIRLENMRRVKNVSRL